MRDLLPTRPPSGRALPGGAIDDDELVARARHDRRAFAPLYARYLDPVHRYCYRRLGSREAAEDATSLVFAKALAALPAYRDGSFRSWLFGIAHHVVADDLRRCRPHAALDAAGDLLDAAPSPEELALAAEERSSIRDLLARLPAEQCQIIELRLAGLTGPEIAAVLGRSLAAVKVGQFRAYARLRVLLGVVAESQEVPDGRR
jgi:RNA polymerase sigma-70 factor (ECF subfamily)